MLVDKGTTESLREQLNLTFAFAVITTTKVLPCRKVLLSGPLFSPISPQVRWQQHLSLIRVKMGFGQPVFQSLSRGPCPKGNMQLISKIKNKLKLDILGIWKQFSGWVTHLIMMDEFTFYYRQDLDESVRQMMSLFSQAGHHWCLPLVFLHTGKDEFSWKVPNRAPVHGALTLFPDSTSNCLSRNNLEVAEEECSQCYLHAPSSSEM